MKDVEKLSIKDTSDGAVISVKVVPGSSRDAIAGVLGESLKIATSAPPEKGKANAAIAKILAQTLGLNKRDVQLVSGQTNPRKDFLLTGMNAEQIREKLSEV